MIKWKYNQFSFSVLFTLSSDNILGYCRNKRKNHNAQLVKCASASPVLFIVNVLSLCLPWCLFSWLQHKSSFAERFFFFIFYILVQHFLLAPSITNNIFSQPPKCPSIFVNQNIFTHNLLLLSGGSERLIGNFSSKTTVQRFRGRDGRSQSERSLALPWQHRNKRTESWERGREGGMGREREKIWSNVNTLFWFERLIYSLLLPLSPHFDLLFRRTHANTRVFKKHMHAHTHTDTHTHTDPHFTQWQTASAPHW